MILDRLVMSRGNLFAVTAATGDVAPASARELGIFHQDTRHLSHYELVLPGGSPTLLSSGAISAVLTQIDLTATDVEFGGLLDEPINFLHVRRKQLLDDDFVDQIVFTNYLGHAVDVAFEVRYAADFADVFEVRGARRARRGEFLPPASGGDRVELRYRGVDGDLYRTVLRFTPEPVTADAEHATFRLHLEPGEAQVQEIVVGPARDAAVRPAKPAPRAIPDRGLAGEAPLWPFDVRVARTRHDQADFLRRCTRVTCDNRVQAKLIERAVTDVHSLRILHDGEWIVGAGIPWFAAPFGRDALITSAQLLAIAPHLAAETLRFLGHYQGKSEDPWREEEAGKIMHELRRGEMARTREIPHSPYYGTIDATELYVILAGETWRWTADQALLGEIWPNVERCMEWIDRRTDGGSRFLAYQRMTERGLDNQGWKDSRDGVSFPDGRRATPPIALIEVQGYVIDAYRHAAALAAVRGEGERARAWAERGERLARRLDSAFWVPDTEFYALAIDGAGRQVPTVSSNPGHLLWSRALPRERASRVAEVLLSPELYSGWGIRTVGRGQTVYNPIAYHNGTVWPHDNAMAALGMSRYGMADRALTVLEGLFAAGEHFRQYRLPELFCGMARGEREFLVEYPVSCSPQAWASGSVFMLLQAALGLDPHAPAGRLAIRNPKLPRSIRQLDLLGMRVGNANVSLRFARSGRRTHTDVLDVRGGPLKIEIEID
jgi:glycogen debranching enzyme